MDPRLKAEGDDLSWSESYQLEKNWITVCQY